jgi:hypothetical protein
MLTSSHSFPERFLNALTADFLYANSVMSENINPTVLLIIQKNFSPELFNIYSNDRQG